MIKLCEQCPGATYTYDVYGQVTVRVGAGTFPTRRVGNPYTFTGRRLDDETGLLHYRHRYYNPSLGRFLARDPQGYADSLNLYEYVNSNPINRVDPFGLESNTEDSWWNKLQEWLIKAGDAVAALTVSGTVYAPAEEGQPNALDELAERAEARWWYEGALLRAFDPYDYADTFALCLEEGCDSVVIAACLLPGVSGRAGRYADELVEGSVTRLWRAVEPEELADIQRYGDYNIHPNSTFKRFAFNESDIDNFIQANPTRQYTKTYIDIPTEKLRYMTPHTDPGGVGRAIGIDVYEHPEFYEWFDIVHIIE